MPVISSTLGFADTLGAWKARWGIGRMRYLVPPGLYALGSPGPDAPVVVTANYKMSYDIVRRTLAGRDIWLMLLETYGVNVWCAAGKGTFGTGELVRRLDATGLENVVEHRELILPIFGAAGVKAVEVRQRTGFNVSFATLRADDLPEYLDNGLRTTDEMRKLTFSLRERLVLVPIELLQGGKGSLPLMAVFFLLGAFAGGSFFWPGGMTLFLAYCGALITGTVLAPLLLPLLPTRSFAIKGWSLGGCWALIVAWGLRGNVSVPQLGSLFLLLPPVSSFYALNFTGSTPFTSRSGVKKEMRLSLPAMGTALATGLALWLVEIFRH